MIPLRFHELPEGRGQVLFTADTGAAFVSDEAFLQRYIHENLSQQDRKFLQTIGLLPSSEACAAQTNYLFKLAQRHRVRGGRPDYFIVVPTLRCDLRCSYCQVSRANADAIGFDWTDQIYDDSFRFIAGKSPEKIKLEFQGGEPTLRLDLVERLIVDLQALGKSVEAVICTNLSRVTADLLRLLDRGNVFISTSIDGSVVRHAAQRTGSIESAQTFFENLDKIIATYGAEKVSALPTIDPFNPPTYAELMDAFAGRGITSIFLRPINFQGFARKQYASSLNVSAAWKIYYAGFIDFLVETGDANGFAVSEFYFTQCLRRIFRAGENGHVDLRNPNVFGLDYMVIDYDGRLFPTDEARMLDRIGEADLSIGNVRTGIDFETRDALNQNAFNDEDPDCIHCAFQPYCGTDLIDAISRYGRVDVPRHETAFCERQTEMFEHIFSMLSNPTEKQRRALSHWLGLAEPPATFLEAIE